MKQSLNKTELSVRNNIVKVIQIGEIDYISLTDLAKYADKNDSRYPIQNWMRTKDVILYLGLWEKLHNKDFKRVEFDTFEKNAESNKFKISPQKWIKETNAIGMISKSGNSGGTYARSEIAFEFASWLSPEFKLWILTKVNCSLHTDSIKKNIVPNLTDKQKTISMRKRQTF